jgi:hypothetical protein
VEDIQGELAVEDSNEYFHKSTITVPAAETEFRTEAAWFVIKPLDQTPYVISDRAVEEKWVPPRGVSALPLTIREQVPPEFAYWLAEGERERLAIRDAFVKQSKKNSEISRDSSGHEGNGNSRIPTLPRFSLQYQYWISRGEKPIREGPSVEAYDLRIQDSPGSARRWRLDFDPRVVRELSGLLIEEDADYLDLEGFIPPGDPLNETKETLSFIERLDGGPVEILEDKPGLLKIRFSGKNLKGIWLLTRHNSEWLIEETEEAPVLV